MFQFDFEPEDPEMECPTCCVLMDWKHRQSQFHCVQCDEIHELKTYAERDFSHFFQEEYQYVN